MLNSTSRDVTTEILINDYVGPEFRIHNDKQRSKTVSLLITGLLLMVLLVSGCARQEIVKIVPKKPYSRDLMHGEKFYKVKKGDTLYAIGFRSGHGYRRLAEWNNITPPYRIQINQTIKLFKPKRTYSNKKTPLKQPERVKKKRNSAQKKSSISIDNKKMLKLYWQWPINGRILTTFSHKGNKGIDIQGRKGQSVRSAAEGKVVYSGNGLIGYGNLLIVKHNDEFLSAYAHNRRLFVNEGQKVKKGQVIAEVGRNSENKISLHFEIRKNGKPVNPVNYLPKK